MAKDVELFRIAMADVLPLKGRRRLRVPTGRSGPAETGSKEKPKASPKRAEQRTAPAPPVGSKPQIPAAEPLSFDRDVDRALSRGRRTPEATLDLHGMTLVAAERAVSRFLEEAAALDMRVVLIVTGKGLRQEGDRVFGGRIRAEFPLWLRRAENRARVRGVKAAHARHGGGGAFYVLMRRRSSASRRSLRPTPQR
ncbi:MAG: Smr/MutS family protein [Proteobacteria bacterium]|nr:Smr/MutS family protein [Pseudomonadota bacterium]